MDNGRTNALNRRINYINRELVFKTVLKIANNDIIKKNVQEFELTTTNFENNEKKFPIIKPK